MKLGLERRKMVSGFLFISPWLVGFIAFLVFPLVKSLYMSFREIHAVADMQMTFVGWDNYSKAILKDTQFIPFFYNAIQDAIIEIPLILVFSFFIATLLNQETVGRMFFRGAFFLPVIIGSGFVMQQLLGQGIGGLDAVKDPTEMMREGVANGLAVPGAIAMYLPQDLVGTLSDIMGRLTIIFWKTGIQILLFLAGLQGISDSLYESAKCDGATPWEMFWKITFPLMTPVLLLNGIFTLVDSFTDMRNNVMRYIQRVAFTNIEFGYAAALGWIYFLLVFLLIVLIFALTRKRVFYAGDR
ncbi:carbohydrate ABC transporter permease [Paenibacillus sp. J2TS4]|uniref:carbohydrate ABC transporter permease n=1 Tax=Paenibacillus sp. J2TS4 TaxID=2807194 RepID=UPI001B067390|nr:sugar ABC transporter permease [Paenibacillus sp. J2TS4]GIP31893.1 lactose ABC transporter permease [Paenibacillus sp. J2TS4]